MSEIITTSKEEFLNEIVDAQVELARAINKFFNTQISIKQRKRGYATINLMETLKIKKIDYGRKEIAITILFMSDEMGKQLSNDFKQDFSLAEQLGDKFLNNFK